MFVWYGHHLCSCENENCDSDMMMTIVSLSFFPFHQCRDTGFLSIMQQKRHETQCLHNEVCLRQSECVVFRESVFAGRRPSRVNPGQHPKPCQSSRTNRRGWRLMPTEVAVFISSAPVWVWRRTIKMRPVQTLYFTVCQLNFDSHQRSWDRTQREML